MVSASYPGRFQRLKNRTLEIIEPSSTGDAASRAFDIFILSLISLNVIAIILETEASISAHYTRFLDALEVFSVIVFTVEYTLRLWTCGVRGRFHNRVLGRVKYAFTPLALVDLLSILPFYLPMVLAVDLRFIRAIRLFRLFRLLKFGRYSESLTTLGTVLKAKQEELVVITFVTAIMSILAGSLMYLVEHEAQPSAFSSIPATMWWVIVTLTTVGYGDIYPIAPIGKVLGGIMAILGIGVFALPAGILASGFAEEIRRKNAGVKLCPHCGGSVDDLT